MKEVCLVYMATGQYDSYSNDVILAFETLEEGEQAIEAMKKELEAVWKVPEPSDAFRNLPIAERGDGSYDRLRNEYAAKIKEIVKVFPASFSTHQDIEFVGGIPDEREKRNGDLDFAAVMQPITKLVDLLTSSAKQDG